MPEDTQAVSLDIAEFNPKQAELQALAESCSNIDLTDLKAVKEKRLELKNARVEITKTGKAMREGATAFGKAVIAREKELVAIIEPEEDKLAEIEAKVKLESEREERRPLIPVRHERLATIGDAIEVSAEQLLEMDGATFEGYFNQRLADKNVVDKAEIDRTRLAQEQEALRLENEAKSREREAQARQEERDSAERAAKQREIDAANEAEDKRIEKIANRKRELVNMGLMPNQDTNCFENEYVAVTLEQVNKLDDGDWAVKMVEARNEIARAVKAQADKEAEQKRLADEEYQTWLTGAGYDKETCLLVHEDYGEVKLYRLVTTYIR